MKYKFKFESVKRIKEVFEKKAQKELMAIQLEIEKTEANYKLIQIRRMEETKKHVKISSSHDLKFHKNYMESLKIEMEKIRMRIDELLNEKEKKLQELVQKSKEHEMFNALEKIHHGNFQDEQNKIEMNSMDEIAISRFTAGRKN